MNRRTVASTLRQELHPYAAQSQIEVGEAWGTAGFGDPTSLAVVTKTLQNQALRKLPDQDSNLGHGD
jgi:hypothetical protein